MQEANMGDCYGPERLNAELLNEIIPGGHSEEAENSFSQKFHSDLERRRTWHSDIRVDPEDNLWAHITFRCLR